MPLALVAYTPRGYTAVRMLWIAYTEALEDTMTDTILDSSPLVPDEAERKKIINRLRRLEGQVRGLQSMIDSGQECDAVLTQIMAAKSALNQVSLHIIGYAMKRCLVENDPAMSRDEVIDQAIGVFLKYSSCVK
jgi:DNA-binding FrmR family transcriptional regulator